MTSKELLPCPICQGSVSYAPGYYREGSRVWPAIVCQTPNCRLTYQPVIYPDNGEIFNNWNHRLAASPPLGDNADREAAANFLQSWEPGPETTVMKLSDAFARHRLAASPPEKPWCETCGEAVSEILCPKCAKWWNDNPPPLGDNAGATEDLDTALDLIAEAKGADGPNGGFVTDHLDFAEHWIRKASASILALEAENAGLRRALERMFAAADDETTSIDDLMKAIDAGRDTLARAALHDQPAKGEGG